MNSDFFIGLIIVSIATGCMTTAPIGWFILGSGILLVSFLKFD